MYDWNEFAITESGLYDDPADILDRAEQRANEEHTDDTPAQHRARVDAIYARGEWA